MGNDDVETSFERLELVCGRILHRYFVSSRIGLIRSDECVVLSDGRRSQGCAREEFRTYVSVGCVYCWFKTPSFSCTCILVTVSCRESVRHFISSYKR